MRDLINIITNCETLNEAFNSEQLIQHILRQLEENATYIALIRNTPGDDALTAVRDACRDAKLEPRVVSLGHNMVGRELPDNLFNGGLVILGITGNLAMTLREAGLKSLREQIANARHNGYPTSIIVVEPGHHASALGEETARLFPEIEYRGGLGRKIDDGGIHRIT